VKTIENQRKSIMQLSTPVIPVWDKILILPLTGVLDEERAQRLIDNLLKKISETRASISIVDITGVAEVDASVARYLLKTSHTAHLIGCTCIFTGISPDNAKILATAGVNLSEITTRITLQDGLELAFQLTKIKLVKTE
jgi:rsbT co-antagonist protein RsbR